MYILQHNDAPMKLKLYILHATNALKDQVYVIYNT